jgi:hypothetical protein
MTRYVIRALTVAVCLYGGFGGARAAQPPTALTLRLPVGYASPHFVNQGERPAVMLADTRIAVFDRPLMTRDQLVKVVGPLMEQAVVKPVSIVILAPGVGGPVLEILAINAARGVAAVCVLDFAGVPNADVFLGDIAAALGTPVLSAQQGGVALESLGLAAKVESSPNGTQLWLSAKQQQSLSVRREALRKEGRAKPVSPERDVLSLRLALLQGRETEALRKVFDGSPETGSVSGALDDSAVRSLVAKARQSVSSGSQVLVHAGYSVRSAVRTYPGIQIRATLAPTPEGVKNGFEALPQPTAPLQFENADIVVTSDAFTEKAEAMLLLQELADRRRPIVIVSDRFRGDALAVFDTYRANGAVRSLVLESAQTGGLGLQDRARFAMSVLAGVIESRQPRGKPRNFTANHAGEAPYVQFDGKTLTVFDDGQEPDARLSEKQAGNLGSDEERQRALMLRKAVLRALQKKRLAGLSSKIAVIEVGGRTLAEQQSNRAAVLKTLAVR